MPQPDDVQLASDLLAATIHEIKNRFGLLYGQLDRLLGELPLAPQHEHEVATIKSEAQFIASELVRVLASYRALNTTPTVNVNQQFVVEFLEEKVARHVTTAAAHQLQIDFECDEDLTGFFDAGIVSVVLDTAIYNAVKAQVKRILLTAQEQGGELLLAIHDDGPGFPATVLEQPIGPGNLDAARGTTGLGLYFAQRLLGLHQEGERRGHLTLGQSDRLGGACVLLHLPQ